MITKVCTEKAVVYKGMSSERIWQGESMHKILMQSPLKKARVRKYKNKSERAFEQTPKYIFQHHGMSPFWYAFDGLEPVLVLSLVPEHRHIVYCSFPARQKLQGSLNFMHMKSGRLVL